MSLRLAVYGAVVLCGSYLALFVVMPIFTPFQFVSCLPKVGYTGCFTSLNLAYPLVFIVSIVGTVVMLLGLLGKTYVLSPVSVIGMIALEWGLAAVVSASLNSKSGASTNPIIFAPYVALGAFVLCFQAFRRRRPPPMS